jgi:hypothetical protein
MEREERTADEERCEVQDVEGRTSVVRATNEEPNLLWGAKAGVKEATLLVLDASTTTERVAAVNFILLLFLLLLM